MSKGWISLHRQFQDHWLWEEPRKYSKAEAWLDILMSAAHKEYKAVINENIITCERGEWIASIRFLQKRWQWSNSKIVKFLLVLEKDDMLTLEKKTGVTVIKVSNYNEHQDREEIKKTQKRQQSDGKATPERQQSDKDNKVNKVNNENKTTTVTTPAIAWSMTDGWSGISDKDYQDWKEAYPACDIPRHLASANQWLLSNPSKAHKKQWRRFITGWLSRSQERGGDVASNKSIKNQHKVHENNTQQGNLI
jgi:hypothetical protein